MRTSALVVILLPALATLSGCATGTLSYQHSAPAKSDPGNEIVQDDLQFETSIPVHISEDKKTIYSMGTTIKESHLAFDEPVFGDLDLYKVKFPISGTHVLKDCIATWTLVPGLHGDTNDPSDADQRVEGNVIIFAPSGSIQWAFGGGFGDDFGEVKAFPILGFIWQASPRSKLTALVPLVKYEYTNAAGNKYNVAVVPEGAEWTWKAGAVGNQYPANIALSGIKTTIGVDFLRGGNSYYFINAGIITNRKVEVSRADDPSVNGSLELQSVWVAQVGLRW